MYDDERDIEKLIIHTTQRGSCNIFYCIWKGGLQIGRPHQRDWLGACWGKVDCPSTSADDVQGPQAQNHLQLFKELEREGRPALGLTPLKTLVLNIRSSLEFLSGYPNWPGRPGGSSPLGFWRSRPSTGRTHPFWCSTQAGRRSVGGEGGGGGGGGQQCYRERCDGKAGSTEGGKWQGGLKGRQNTGWNKRDAWACHWIGGAEQFPVKQSLRCFFLRCHRSPLFTLAFTFAWEEGEFWFQIKPGKN